MSTTIANAVVGMKISPEIVKALASIDHPEVQEMIKRLGEFNLGVCLPHMHLPDVDFATMPTDVVQVEKDCQVSWVARSALEALPGSVPVAWRWHDDGVHAAAKCSQVCARTDDGHVVTGHLPIG